MKKGVAFIMFSVKEGEKGNSFAKEAISQMSCKYFVNTMDDMYMNSFPRPE